MDQIAATIAAYKARLPLKAVVLGVLLGAGLSACANTSASNQASQTSPFGGQVGQAPVSLIKSFGGQNSTIQKINLSSGAVAKAVDRYRINKKADPSPYQQVGVDLNGDGQAEALVYLTGETWCAKTGCTLAIFRKGQFGFRPLVTIRRVKLPIRVGGSQTQGWHDLIVNTGGAGMPLQTVALKFTGRGYPGNATTIAPIPQGVQTESTIVLDGPAYPVATVSETTPQPINIP